MKRYLLYALPVLFLLLFLFQLPLYVPSFLLGRTVFMAYNRSTEATAVFDTLQAHREVFLLCKGEAYRLQRRAFPTVASLASYLAELPQEEFNVLESHLGAISASTPALKRARLVLNRRLDSEEIAALNRLVREQNLPVELELDPPPYDPLFLSFSYAYGSQDNTIDFDLLFSPKVSSYKLINIYLGEALLESVEPPNLEQGRHYRTSLPAETAIQLEVELTAGGSVIRQSFRIHTPQAEDSQILMISNRVTSRSFLESLYATKKMPLAKAMEEDLLEFPLLVFDGIPMGIIDAELTAVLADIHQNAASSILFVSDTPGFGKRGDNPAIEEILPVVLAPRSLKYLPDLGILILLDISASMMGDKLSLAKLSTLELLKNLKDSDRVSILTFWDQYRFLHGFEQKSNLNSRIQLAPLLAEGGTDLFRALDEGLSRLAELDMPQKHVIILTDGKTKEGDFDSLIDRALFEETTMSTVAVGEDINSALLNRLAQSSGGNYYEVLSLEEIPSIIFEDRKEIARASFAEDLFSVYDYTDTPVGTITGMSLFTAKPERIVLYRNQYEDPLFLLEKKDRQLTMMFLSDIYGRYTESFLSDTSVLRTFRTTLDSILEKNTVNVRVAESFQNLSLTVNGEGLVDPSLALYRDNTLVAERSLDPGSFLTYGLRFGLPDPGFYTAILYSRGEPLLRFPLYFNGNMEGQTTEAQGAPARLDRRIFKRLPIGLPYLLLFFLSSVAVTYFSRRTPRSGPTNR